LPFSSTGIGGARDRTAGHQWPEREATRTKTGHVACGIAGGQRDRFRCNAEPARRHAARKPSCAPARWPPAPTLTCTALPPGNEMRAASSEMR